MTCPRPWQCCQGQLAMRWSTSLDLQFAPVLDDEEAAALDKQVLADLGAQ